MTVFSIGSATKPVSQGRSSRVAATPQGTPAFQGEVVVAARRVEMSYRSWGQMVQVLHGVDLDIYRGEVQLLMGPSGSGKTTLLSIMAGILTPTGGSVELMGQEITGMDGRQLARFRLEHIGFIFQGFNLFPALTAQENVEVALNLKGIPGRSARRMAQELLDRVGLSEKASSLPKQLSGGQKQRVAIARALAANPPLVFADEPTAALDAHSGHAVMDLLHGLAKEDGATVVIVTHDPRIVDVADRIAYMEDGQLRERAL
ncbi:MAG: ABC transporter ATP-binding protein [Cyanophyceae cyanobacterium]